MTGIPNQGVVYFVIEGSFFCFSFVFRVYAVHFYLLLLVSNSAIDCLVKIDSKMTYYVSSGTLKHYSLDKHHVSDTVIS